MNTEQLEALKAEAERLWIIQGQEEKKYRAHLSAWCEANEKVRVAQRELEIEQKVVERLAKAQEASAAA